jgi:hypothetical protein
VELCRESNPSPNPSYRVVTPLSATRTLWQLKPGAELALGDWRCRVNASKERRTCSNSQLGLSMDTMIYHKKQLDI